LWLVVVLNQMWRRRAALESPGEFLPINFLLIREITVPDDHAGWLSQAAVSQLFMSFPLPLVLLDPGGTAVCCNDRFSHQFGAAAQAGPLLRDMAARSAGNWQSVVLAMPGGGQLATRACTLPTGAGALVVVDDEPEGNTPVAAELEKLRGRVAELERSSATDHLTGAWNRAHLDDVIESEMARSLRFRQPLSLILLDIDHFKNVNDTHGHQAGDVVLCELVAIIRAKVRSADLLFRWGGEEFVVLAPSTGYRNAEVLAEVLRERVAQQHFSVVSALTISLGVAEHQCAESANAWFARLDAALYAAKGGGRNRVVVDRCGSSDAWAADGGAAALRLTWQEAYECGDPVIDREHRELFDLANALIDLAFGNDALAVAPALDRLVDHIDEMQPLVYTPTVGLACQRFGHIFQRPRGIFISANDRGRVAQVLANWPYRAGIIVVTDGERILGLGDLGANGMGIPVGKLSLYTACAGIHPHQCLPVTLDVGTNNEMMLNDPFYVGLRQRRITGPAYDELIEEFITAAREAFPGVVIQFEDFANHNAFRLLHKYRDRICTFNDDIQGTAAVALAGILSALRVTGGKLANQRLLFMGAGEAATGIADLVAAAMEAQGLTAAQARARCWLFDSRGLVVKSRTDLVEHKRPYAHEHAQVGDFLSAIKTLKPTAIIGVAAVGGTFTQAVLEEMARINERPIVFALSNPTSQAECTAEEAYRHTAGRVLFACGSPFDPVKLNGTTFVPRQGNNSYIFPGVGLGAITSQARLITDDMFMAAAHTLARQVTESDLAQGSLYPALPRIREVSASIAAAVANTAYKENLAGKQKPADVLEDVQAQMFNPRY